MDAARSAELDALRRRLYAPDATPEDRAAYAAAEAAAAPSRPAASAAAAVPGLPRPHRRRIVAAGAGLLVVAGIAALVTTHPLAALTAPTTATTTAGSTTEAAPGDDRIVTAEASRLRFVLALQGGGHAGLLDYFYSHPTLLPAALRTTGRAASAEYSGLGSGMIPLDPSRLAEQGGRMTVIVVTDRSATYAWQAERIVQDNDRSGPVVEVASHGGATRPGEPVAFTVRYGRGAPGRITLQLNESVRWGAAVVFTD